MVNELQQYVYVMHWQSQKRDELVLRIQQQRDYAALKSLSGKLFGLEERGFATKLVNRSSKCHQNPS